MQTQGLYLRYFIIEIAIIYALAYTEVNVSNKTLNN